MTDRNSSVTERVPTFDECIARAVQVLIEGAGARAAMTPREAAEAAYYPGHRLGSVKAIEAEIIRRRSLMPIRPAEPRRAA